MISKILLRIKFSKILLLMIFLLTFFISYFIVGTKADLANYVYLDISYGNISFTDESYSGYDLDGNLVNGVHDVSNYYVISQSNGDASLNSISVGNSTTAVLSDFIIYLDGVNIRNTAADSSAFSVNTKAPSTVVVILKDESKNFLYSGKNRAGLEKSGGASSDGLLVITCEEGYKAWLSDENVGHVHTDGSSACSDSCGSLDAKSGNAWHNISTAETYYAGAGIGTNGYGSGGSAKAGVVAGNNALVNLTIAGGNIEATGARGLTVSGSSGGAASIGTGSARSSSAVAGTVNGLKITGGNIVAYRGDSSAACIGGGYRSGYVNMEIYGGTIDATKYSSTLTKYNQVRAAGIGGGGGGTSSASPAGATVTIYNGNIKASGMYSAAIGAGAGGSTGSGEVAVVNIYGGNIVASTTKGNGNGAGAGIGTGGSLGTGHGGEATINITGGFITANSELGADIGGGGTNSTTDGVGGKGIINISGGTITALKGGIGGGKANAGAGGDANLTITGGTINAYSISGGASQTNNGGRAIVKISDGIVNTGSIGGGVCLDEESGKIGSAEVEVTGGTIRGQFIMDSTNLLEDAECYFKMSGGTIDNKKNADDSLNFPFTQKNGSAVYINGKGNSTDAIVHMSGGIIKNTSAELGGAIYITGGGSMLMSGGTIEKSTSLGDGGAIYIDDGGDFEMKGGTINNCEASSGGAVYVNGGSFDMTDGKLLSNTSLSDGGAVYIADGAVTMSSGTIKGNAASNGGGIYVSGGSFTLTGGVTSNNSAEQFGGGIYVAEGQVELSSGSIIENTALNGAGGYISGGSFNLIGGSISYNKASKSGGGFYILNTKTSLSNGVISNNEALNGGGFYQTQTTGDTSTTLSGTCYVNNNRAVLGNGGGIYIDGGSTFRIVNGKVIYNLATGNPKDTDVKSFVYDNNVATTNEMVYAKDSSSGVGGGVYIKNGTFTMKNEDGTYGNAAIFGNDAEYAADDLFAYGNGLTSFDAIPVINMIKDDAYLNSTDWFEDYPKGEYHASLKISDNSSKITSNNRFKKVTNETLLVTADSVLSTSADYICITMGANVGTIVLNINDFNVGSDNTFVYLIEDISDNIKMKVSVKKGKETKIINVPIGSYKITLENDWSWRYNNDFIATIIKGDTSNVLESSNSININVVGGQTLKIDTKYDIKDKKYLGKNIFIKIPLYLDESLF